MATGIILSGGVGTRMGFDAMPKQYVVIGGQPIIAYATQAFSESSLVDRIVVVAAKEWRDDILTWFTGVGIDKPLSFAEPGPTRQESILNGLEESALQPPSDDVVVVHDAARPNLKASSLDGYIRALEEGDAVLPALPMNDTMYRSRTGRRVDAMLSRDEVFAGQAPEVFRLSSYLKLNRSVHREELASTRGSSEIAFKHGMEVILVPGDPNNFKITTRADLRRFCEQAGENYERCLQEAEKRVGDS